MPSRDSRLAAVVSLRGPSDVVAAIPHLLGFVPHESVVVVALHDSGRVGLTMRLDLAEEEHDDAVARALAAGVARDRATGVVVVVFTEADDRDGELPRSRLADAVCETMPVPVRDLLLVRNSRWWAYGCDDAACCPSTGRSVDQGSAGALAVAAAYALTGRAVLAHREAVVSSIASLTGPAQRAMHEAIERAGAEFAATGRRRYAATVCTLVARLLDRYDEPPATLSDDEAASCVVALHDVGVRDTLIRWSCERPAAAYRLLLDLAPKALPPLDAPTCTVLACCAYTHGEGVIAGGALDRALASDPDYSLAALVRSALDRQMHPVELREAMRQAWLIGGPAS